LDGSTCRRASSCCGFNIGRRTPAAQDGEWAKFIENYRDTLPQAAAAGRRQGALHRFRGQLDADRDPPPGNRPSARELFASWPSIYGLEPFLRRRLGQQRFL
jgi:hypothetical protein